MRPTSNPAVLEGAEPLYNPGVLEGAEPLYNPGVLEGAEPPRLKGGGDTPGRSILYEDGH